MVMDSEEKIEFMQNDYSPYNEAVQTELDKHSAILSSLKSERFVSYMKGFVLICLGIAVLLIALVFSYKYFLSEPQIILSTTDVGIQDDLNDIDEVQDKDIASDSFIQTRYTVFHDAITVSGEHVITGLEYSPLNTRTPLRQYCYLQAGKTSQEILAEVKDGIVVTLTQSVELKDYPGLYCNFVAS